MFTPLDYFSMDGVTFSPLFEQTYVWDIIGKISFYIHKLPLGKIEVDIPSGVYLENPELISIGYGTKIEAGAYIKGPAIIGRHCEIRHGAYIRENVLLSDHCLVGHSSEVKNSIFLPFAKASHFNYVGDSILGHHTNLGAGVKCSNFRFDGKEIHFWFEGKKIMTGLKKLGLILGDCSQIGCNSVTNPGTIITKKVFSPPGIVMKGWIGS